jgi:hypothetical protein
MQREVRRFTRALGERRGRPFYLAARVCPSIEGSMRTGYDVPIWIVSRAIVATAGLWTVFFHKKKSSSKVVLLLQKEGLVDIVIPAANSGTDIEIDVGRWRELCASAPVPVALYPCHSTHPDGIQGRAAELPYAAKSFAHPLQLRKRLRHSFALSRLPSCC